MPRVDGEAESCFRPAGQSEEQVVWCLDQRAALLADEMCMRLRGQLVGGRAVPEMGVHDHPEKLEVLQVPVDG